MKSMAVPAKLAIIYTVCGYMASLGSVAGVGGVPRSFVADLIAFYRVNYTKSRI